MGSGSPRGVPWAAPPSSGVSCCCSTCHPGEALVHPARGPAQHTRSFPGPQAASVPFDSQLYICAACGALTAVLGSHRPLGPHTLSLERCPARRRVGGGRRPGWQLSPEAGAATWLPWALGVKRGRDLPGRVSGGLGGAGGRGQGLSGRLRTGRWGRSLCGYAEPGSAAGTCWDAVLRSSPGETLEEGGHCSDCL